MSWAGRILCTKSRFLKRMANFGLFETEVATGHRIDQFTGECSCGDPLCEKRMEVEGVAYDRRTYAGHDFFEVSSAMQKMIRRGKEREAIYWALELEEKYHNYMWKRLTIISHEEIGITNPSIPMMVNAYREQYYFLRDAKASERLLVLGNTIMLLCREPKCRIGDNFINVALRDRRGPEVKEVPDVALDAHTRRGKMKGRGWDQDGLEFWFTQSSKVENEVEGMDIYLEERRELSEAGIPDRYTPNI